MTDTSLITKPRHDPNRPLPTPPDLSKAGSGVRYTPYLVVRSQAGDNGARPLPGGAVFWESPDVWCQGAAGTNQPVVGDPTTVFARVTNQGLKDSDVVVKFWWADPSIAISEQSANLIGIAYTAVRAGNSAVVPCPVAWTPVPRNGGHECLMAEAYVPQLDPLTHPMDPTNDRHVGQKNETVLLVAPGQSFSFTVVAHNLTANVQPVTVEARIGVIPRDFGRRFAGKMAWPSTLLDPMRVLTPTLAFQSAGANGPPRVLPIRPVGTIPIRPAAASTPAHPAACFGPALASTSHDFKASERREVLVGGTLPATAHVGEVHAIRITQHIGQHIVGGYTLYVTAAG